MNKKNLVLLNNEKVFTQNNEFYCDNLDLKVLPEGLSDYFNVKYIVRKSKKKGGQKINLTNIEAASNIFLFIYYILRSFGKESKYLIISITPYTFIAYFFLLLFRKKVYLYLFSDGYEEWNYLVGKWAVWIFHLMYIVCTFRSEIIVCNNRLTKKKSHLISISRLDHEWFQNKKKVQTSTANFLYVGRLSKEKGIFDFIKLFKQMNNSAKLSIAGDARNFKLDDSNINLLGYISDPSSLIKTYDSCNITILPSYTEGYPYVIDESLARGRPVIIFEEISYVLNNKKGIFITKRDVASLSEVTKYILNNYGKIQDEILQNSLPTKKSMLKQISDIINI